MDWLAHLDRTLLFALNGFARHSVILDKTDVILTDMVFVNGGMFFLFLWWLWFRPGPRSEEDRAAALRIAIAICVAVALARGLQVFLPPRLRPLNDPDLGFVLPFGQEPGALEHWNSFPSDHAIVFFALATAIWRRHRGVGAFAFAWIAVLNALTRVYAGFHYPSDVLGGALIGIVVMRLSEAPIFTRAAAVLAGRALLVERRWPALFYCGAVALTYQFVTLFDEVRMIGRGMAAAVVGH